MTEREAKKWERQRARGQLCYSLRGGSHFFAVIAILHLILNDSVPFGPLSLAVAGGSPMGAVLAYLRWDYAELQYSLFRQSQACSENASRA